MSKINVISVLSAIFWLILATSNSLAQDLEVSLPFSVSDGINTIDLTVGVSPDGSASSFVEGLDQLAPPAPPDGAFDARMKVNGTSYFTKYFDNALTEKTAVFEYAAENGAGPITLTWDSDALNTLGTFTITDNFTGSFFTQSLNDLSGTYTVPSPGLIQDSFRLVFTPSGNAVDNIAETPVFSPEGGTFTGSVAVTISSGTAGASIYYTTNGSDPNESSTLYSGPITLSESATLRAMAVANGFQNSAIASATYTIETDEPPADIAFGIPFLASDGENELVLTVGVDPQGQLGFVEGLDVLAPPPPPDGAFDARVKVNGVSYFDKYQDNSITEKTFAFEFSPESGNSDITFTWNDAFVENLADITITDTFGGSIFNRSLTEYSGSFTPAQENPVLANGFLMLLTPKDGGSQIAEAPVFSPGGGTYTESVSVTITSATENSTIYYTTDGSAPDENDSIYNGAVVITETTTLKAVTVANGFLNSLITSAVYTIENDEPPSGLIFSLPFNLSDGVNDLNLTIGVDPAGSSTSFVEGLDQLAPPAPPDGAFDARMKVNGTSYFTKYFDNEITEKTAVFEYAASSGNGPITLSWDSDALNTLGTFTITDNFSGALFTQSLNDLSGTYTVPSPGLIQDSFRLVFTPSGNTVDPFAATPVFSPNGGTFDGSVDVTITTSSPGASIYYTLDGSNPDASSNIYAGPLTFDESTTLKAVAGGEGYRLSAVNSAEYSISSDYEFILPFYLTDGLNALNLFIGVSPDGSDVSYVEDLDQLAPPEPPDGAFDARLKVNGTSFFTKYFSNDLIEKNARFEYSASNGNGPVTLHWDANTLNDLGEFTITDTFSGDLFTQSLNALNGSYTIPSPSLIQDAFNLVFTPSGNDVELMTSIPTFDPEGGLSVVYEESVDVSISSDTPGAVIYYTTDGSVPTQNSNVYINPITLTESSTIRAVANADGFRQSTIEDEKYIVKQKAVSPVINPQSGTFVESVEVTLSTESDGANIYYTLDGSEPTTTSNIYTEPLVITNSLTLKTIAGGDTFLNSDVAEASYTILIIAEEPEFSPASGTFIDSVDITLSTSTTGASIFYTLDGTEPTLDSDVYTSPISLTESATLKAIAGGIGFVSSEVVEEVYEILITAEAPIISPESGTYIDSVEVVLTSLTDGADVYFTTDGTDPTTASARYIEPIVLEESAVVKAVAGGDGFVTSEVSEATYEVLRYAEPPVFSETGGFYADSVKISLSSTSPGVNIYYSLNGEDPSTDSNLYIEPILLNETVTLKAIAAGNGFIESTVTEAEYLIVDYYLHILAADENEASIQLTLGTAQDATVGYDPVYDQLAPPPPPDGAFDARLKIDGTSYFRAFQAPNVSTQEWQIQFAPTAGYAPVTLTWDPTLLPAEGIFNLRDIADGSFVNIDMREQNELVVSQPFINQLTLTHKLFVEVDQSYLFNWNLVSVPVDAEDNGYQTLFPTASEGTLYNFTVNYVPQTTLIPGTGYWLRFDEADDVTFSGEEIESSLLELQNSWNIIGSISEEAVIDDPDEIVVPGTLFGFGINYEASDKVESGKAYWLATFNEGTVGLIPSAGADVSASLLFNNPLRAPEILDAFDRADILMQNEVISSVYFNGEFPDAIHPMQTSLPPSPPIGNFDVRTEDNRWISEERSVRLRLQTIDEQASLVLTKNFRDSELSNPLNSNHGSSSYNVVFLDRSETPLLQIPKVHENEVIEIPFGTVWMDITPMDESAEVPLSYALEQNYPNPFNPSTVITYALPEETGVRLEVFTLLGQRVAILADQVQKAGNYSVSMDASNLSSGVYIYRLQTASGYVQTRKMMLTK